MYGEVKKYNEQLKSYSEFLANCVKEFKNRKEASQKDIEKAWGFYYNNDANRAIKRFNQAWLLNKDNAKVHGGFSNLMGMRDEIKQSIPLFEKLIKLDPNNTIFYESLATSYGQLFYETKAI